MAIANHFRQTATIAFFLITLLIFSSLNDKVNPPANGLAANFERSWYFVKLLKNRTFSRVGVERIVSLFHVSD
jgi:hypothetical protein